MGKHIFEIFNTYDFYSIDEYGNRKHLATSKNVVTEQFWNWIFQGGNYPAYYQGAGFDSLVIGTGTGTTSPNDTKLFNKVLTSSVTVLSSSFDYNTYSTSVLKAIFPSGGSSYNITECGLESNRGGVSYYLLTHSLITDSENNIISIPKTSATILEVIITIKVTTGVDVSMFYVPANQNPFLVTLLTNRQIAHDNMIVRGWLSSKSKPSSDTSITSTTNGAISVANGSSVSFNNKIIYDNKEILATQGNWGFANYIIYEQLGIRFKLPNSTLISPYRIGLDSQNRDILSVGHGDGIKTDFECPIPQFITGSEVIKINGIVQTNVSLNPLFTPTSTDLGYTVDPKGNSIGHRSASVSDVIGTLTGGTSSGAFPQQITPATTLNTTGIVWTLDYAESFNGLFMRKITSTSVVSITGLKFQVSDDGTNWVDEIIFDNLINISSSTSYTPTNPKFMLSSPVIKKYARLICSSYSGTITYIRFVDTHFGYLGDGIKFLSPPPNEALITINAMIDRPWKDENYYVIKSQIGTMYYR